MIKILILRNLQNICAVILVIAFFLPWVSLDFISLSGFNLAGIGGASFLLWAIPLLSIGVLVSKFMDLDEWFRLWFHLPNRKKISTYLPHASGAVPLFYVLSSRFQEGQISYEGAGIGIYLTFVASGVMLLAAFGVIKIPE